MTSFKEDGLKVVSELKTLITKIDEEQIQLYTKELLSADKVFFVGVGRVKLSLEATAKRFTHLGIECHIVGEITEPPISNNDLLVVGSGSGESIIPLEICRKAKKLGARVVHLTSNDTSSIAKLADVVVKLNSPSKVNNSVKSIQPMTTIFEQGLLIINDVITLQVINQKELTMEKIKARHANLE